MQIVNRGIWLPHYLACLQLQSHYYVTDARMRIEHDDKV